MKITSLKLLLLLFIALLTALPAAAQVIIIEPGPGSPEIWPPIRPPHPPRPPYPRPPVMPVPPERPVARAVELRETAVDAQARGPAVEVRVTQLIYNPNDFPVEAQLLFPVPEGSTIGDFMMIADGKEMPGRLLDKDEARKIYDEIVRRRRDPALLEWVGSALVRTSVFPVPAREERRLTLSYTPVARRDVKLMEFSYPFASGHGEVAGPNRSVRLRIEADEPIRTIYSPTHEVEVTRDGERRANIRWDGSRGAGLFRLLYELETEAVGLTLLSTWPERGEDGYAMLLATPSIEPPRAERAIPKTVLLVLDRSGSMAGEKIEQALGALRFVLERIRPDDTFNVIAYDDRVEMFREETQRAERSAIDAARAWVSEIRPGGSTNISGALTAAMEQAGGRGRPTYVIFLTDGLPTAGEKNEVRIAEMVRQANDGGARLFVFGVGHDVNARLLERLAGGNGGTTEFIAPQAEIEAPVARLYEKLSAPVMTGLTLKMSGGRAVRGYPEQLPDLFAGQQLVWVGRYTVAGDAVVTVEGRVGETIKTLTERGELVKPGEGSRDAFIARIWASRRIADLIEEIDLHGRNEELVEEIVRLSRRHGILTPYTSFLVEEDAPVHAEALSQAGLRLERLGETQGAAANAQRSFKSRLSRADGAAGFAPSQGMAEDFALADQGMEAMAPAVAARSGRLGRPGASAQSDAGSVRREPGEAMRTIGTKTFYRRTEGWIDAAVEEKAAQRAESIERWSERFFELLRERPEAAQYFAFDEPVTVELDGKIYKIVPPQD